MLSKRPLRPTLITRTYISKFKNLKKRSHFGPGRGHFNGRIVKLLFSNTPNVK